LSECTIAQLKLAVETLEEDDAQRIAAIPAVAVIAATAEQKRQTGPAFIAGTPAARRDCPTRRMHLSVMRRRSPRDRRRRHRLCAGCFKVIRHVRDSAEPARRRSRLPRHITRSATAARRCGIAGPRHRLQVHDYLPVYRPRDGIELETSTLSGWVGAATATRHRSSRRYGAT
jgi:transposase